MAAQLRRPTMPTVSSGAVDRAIMVPPVEYEQAHYAALKPEMQPT